MCEHDDGMVEYDPMEKRDGAVERDGMVQTDGITAVGRIELQYSTVRPQVVGLSFTAVDRGRNGMRV